LSKVIIFFLKRLKKLY